MANPKPTGETPANVASHATQSDALDRSALNLLGVFGPSENLKALVRLPNGRVQQIDTGKRLAWGQVVAIDAAGLMVLKNGKTRRIEMPGG
jgi:ribosomal protein L2